MKPEQKDSAVVGFLMAAPLAFTYYEAIRSGSWIAAIVLSIVMFLIYLLKNPLKIHLCKIRLCGCIPSAQRLMPVFQGGHLCEWAVPKGLKIIEKEEPKMIRDKKGKLIPDPSGATIKVEEVEETNDKPTNPGAELGIWWKGWFAWFRGFSFPMLNIELVHKKPGVSPDAPISKQYERIPNQPIEELRHYINRYILAFQVELNDGSRVNIALYATGGRVKKPAKFWINQPSPFAVWENAAMSSVSSCCRGYSFEQLFREDKEDENNNGKGKGGKKKGALKAFDVIQNHMRRDTDLIEATELIGMEGVNWQMEAWEDASAEGVIKSRQRMAEELSVQETAQRNARAAVTTAHEIVKQRQAEQRVAEEEFQMLLKQCGVTDITKLGAEEATRIRMLSVAKFGNNPTILKLLTQMLRVDERKATPDLTTLVEGSGGSSGSGSTTTEILVSADGKVDGKKGAKS